MHVNRYSNDSLTGTKIFKGKFKNFEGVDKLSKDYHLALKLSKIRHGIMTEDEVYYKIDQPAYLKTNHKFVLNELKKLKIDSQKIIEAWCVINEQGKIEPKSIKHYGFIDNYIKTKIDSTLIKVTEWQPACLDENEVKSKIPIFIRLN